MSLKKEYLNNPMLMTNSVNPNILYMTYILTFLGEIKKKLGQMSKLGLPYLPRTLILTKINLERYSCFHPAYLSKKFETKKFPLKIIFS